MKRLVGLALVGLLSVPAAGACPHCRVQAREAVYTQTFVPNAALLLLPLLVIAAIGAALYFSSPSWAGPHGNQPEG